MRDFDRDFDKHFARTMRLAVLVIAAKLAIAGGLIWLAVYAINSFS